MTATERVHQSRNQPKADTHDGWLVSSMDDESIYGKVVHKLDYEVAAKAGLVKQLLVRVRSSSVGLNSHVIAS